MGPRNKLAKFTGDFLTILLLQTTVKDGTVGSKMLSVTDDVIDCPTKLFAVLLLQNVYLYL